MKYTGIAIAIIGLGILMFSLFGGLAPSPQDTANAAGQAVAQRSADLVLPIIFGVVVIGLGAGLYFYGGRGVIQAPSPAVRN